MINFWYRIITGSEHKLSYVMYQFLRALDDNNIYSSAWVVKVKNILNKSGMSFVWNLPEHVGVGHLDSMQVSSRQSWLNNSIIRRLSDIYEQEWLAEVNNHSHCKIYRMFKQRL